MKRKFLKKGLAVALSTAMVLGFIPAIGNQPLNVQAADVSVSDGSDGQPSSETVPTQANEKVVLDISKAWENSTAGKNITISSGGYQIAGTDLVSFKDKNLVITGKYDNNKFNLNYSWRPKFA